MLPRSPSRPRRRRQRASYGQDVAWIEARVRGRVRDEPLPVDAERHLLVGRRHDRAEREREVARLRALELRREAADAAVRVDDGRNATHRDDVRGAHGRVDDVVGREDRRRIGEHELAVFVEEPDRWRMEHGRAEDDAVEQVLGVLACKPAAAEERLQRLRRQLDDAVAVDPTRPAALERKVCRREHAELHYSGSVCTTTSAICGSLSRMRSSISLARACASASAWPAPSRNVMWATSPSSVSRKRRSRGSTPVTSRTIDRTVATSPATSAAPAVSESGSRCVWTAATSGTASTIARSTSSAIACASSSERSPGSFRCSETSVPPPTESTLTLCTSRTRGTASAAACARSRTAASSSGSTWTTTSDPGNAPS